MENAALTALIRSQTELQNAVREVIRRLDRNGEVPRTPSAVLSKQTPEDDVEAFLELFERTATREQWPAADWGGILAPYLIGEAQRACRDLPARDARDYNQLKAAILSTIGYSLPARAQRFHAWSYQATNPPRAQIAELSRLTQNWLATGEETPWIERIIIDRCIRSLPSDA